MPAHLPDDGWDPAIFTTKVVGVFPNADPSVNGAILVLDAASGAPLVTIDAAAVTAARTAAHSGLSIDLLARPDAATVAILGAGAQGWAHLRSAMAVRPITAVRIWNRTGARAAAMAARAGDELGIAASTHDTPGDAAVGADVVCACTNSPTALLTAADVDPGCHVTAIGAFTPDTRELAADLLAAADAVVVDDRAAATEEAGDVLLAIVEGTITADDVVADLSELVAGTTTIDRSDQAITVYKSVGSSAMDAVAARSLLTLTADRHLAVYGTFVPGGSNAEVLLPFGGTWARGTVRGRRLDDGWHGYPGLVLDDEHTSTVQLLTADRIDWAAVDTVEGPGYRRRRTVVRLDDGTATVANTYVLAAAPA